MLVRVMCEQFHLCFVDIFPVGSPIFFPGGVGQLSRIDYLMAPIYLLSRITATRVCCREGRRLQRVSTCRRVDHTPVSMKISCCTLQHMKFQDNREGQHELWQDALQQRSPSSLYHMLSSAVNVALTIFHKKEIKQMVSGAAAFEEQNN